MYWDLGDTGGNGRLLTSFANAGGQTFTPYLSTLKSSVTDSEQTISLNSLQIASDATADSATGQGSNFGVGVQPGVGNQHDGELAEIIVYFGNQSDTEVQKVESYLALKYGLTLDQSAGGQNYIASDGTTDMWNVATGGIYNNDIAGIGQDDDSGLLQLKSRSGSGNIVTIEAASGSVIEF